MNGADASARRLQRTLGKRVYTVGVKTREDGGAVLVVYVVKGKRVPARLPVDFEGLPVRLVRIEKVRAA